MGAVYRARHPLLPGRALALKLLDSGTDDAEGRARFQRVMEALAKASEHRNVVRIMGGTVEGARPFFVMELVDGPTLHQLARGKPLPPREAARIALEIARALVHLHGRGILHRDLKPSNVFVEPGGRVVV